MNEERAPQIPRSYFRFLGKKGGRAGTPAQKAARQTNIAKGRQARLDKLKLNPTQP